MARKPNDETGYVYFDDERRSVELEDPDPFDRIAFAMHALRLLRPPMTVAVYERHAGLIPERGRDFQNPGRYSWAMLGIPPHASREHIAYAVAELADVEDVPYAVSLLLAAPRSS
jgi:hypothetical protein